MHNNGKIFRPSVPVVMSPSILPDEYQQIQYLQSLGNNTINIDYNFSANCGYKIKCCLDALSVGYAFFQSNSAYVYDYLRTTSNGKLTLYRLTHYFLFDIDFDVHTYSMNFYQDFKVIADDVTYYNLPSSSFSFSSLNICSENNASYLKGKIYSFKITDSDLLVFDLYPCYRKLDNVGGLYDIVNDTFYTDVNGRSFGLGPDFTEVLQ